MRLEYSKCNANHYWQVIDSYLMYFDAGNDKIKIVLHFKRNCKHVFDHFPCEFQGTIIKQQTQ